MSIAAPIRGMSFPVAVFLAVIFSGEKIFAKDLVALGLVVAALTVFASAESDRTRLKSSMEAKNAGQSSRSENHATHSSDDLN